MGKSGAYNDLEGMHAISFISATLGCQVETPDGHLRWCWRLDNADGYAVEFVADENPRVIVNREGFGGELLLRYAIIGWALCCQYEIYEGDMPLV